MAVTIKLKNASGSDPSASDLVLGELAVRTDNGKIFLKKDDNSVAEVSGGGGVDDGDKGDITVSNSGATWTIDSGATQVANKLPLAGGTMTGNLLFGDDVKAIFGAGSDLQIFHDGSDDRLRSTGNILLQPASGENGIAVNANGSVDLCFNGTKTAETVSGGFTVTGTCTASTKFSSSLFENAGGDVVLRAGHPHHSITYKGYTHTFSKPTDGETQAKFQADGDVELYYDNSKKFETSTAGANLIGNLSFADNGTAIFGDGDDAQINFNGTDAVFTSAGKIKLYADANLEILDNSSGEVRAKFIDNAGVELYYDNIKTFETTGGGAIIRGTEGGDANLFFYADEGDDNADQWRLQAHSDGSFKLFNYADGANELNIEANGGGNVELYYDNSKKIETTSLGATITRDLTLNHASGDTALRWAVGGTNKFSLYESSGTLRFYDNTNSAERLRITSSGNVSIPNDSGKFLAGAGNDLQIYHDSANTVIEDVNDNPIWIQTDGAIRLTKDAAAEYYATFNPDGAVELYYDGVKKLETTASGIAMAGVENAGAQLKIGASNDIQIEHDGSNSYITNATGNLELQSDSVLKLRSKTNGPEEYIVCTFNGAVELYYNNSKKLETYSNGVQISGRLDVSDYINITGGADLYLADNGKANFGNSTDLEIYHDGSHSYIKNETGSLFLRSDYQIYFQDTSGNKMIDCVDGSHVSLYYDGSQKFYTQSDKVVSAGHHYPESNNSYDLGHSSYRWRNIYVNDMHFANSPENTNSVDGTWGDWTLQEGDENIFMINNRTGKKYKMGLQEVN